MNRVSAIVVAIVAVTALAATGWVVVGRRTDDATELALLMPRQTPQRGFVSSAECRECHVNEHASWHASYHRRMSQVASPDTVLGSFDNVTISDSIGDNRLGEGEIYHLSRQGDELWVETIRKTPAETHSQAAPVKPGADAAGAPLPPTTRQRVLLTTGSHHMQLFWANGGKGNLLDELPLVYIREGETGGRWAPLEASFLSPTPEKFKGGSHWNTSCVMCHSTGCIPRLDKSSGATETTVAQFGIACEACHGPGDKHVEYERSLQAGGNGAGNDERLAAGQIASGEARAGRSTRNGSTDNRPMVDHRIINPAKLDPYRSSQVCGQCHAVATFVTEQLISDWFTSGAWYRPGDDLNQTRQTVLPAHLTEEQIERFRQANPFFDGSYWPDGMVRAAGREYNGLLESACYLQGGMTCLSCHSMHRSEPDDQLAAGMRGNRACLQCHDSLGERLTEHTHHAADSSGSECQNCHMPHTTYGLFKAIRSHQISIPDASVTRDTGRPNACNLCHLDQTLEWTAEQLARWSGDQGGNEDDGELELDDDERSISAAALWMLKGNLVQRVLMAWGAGWGPAIGKEQIVPLLAQQLDDPSPAIRLAAWRSLRSIDPRYDIDYDFIAPADERMAVIRKIVELWQASGTSAGDRRLLQAADGRLDSAAVRRLMDSRDDRAIPVRE